MLLSAMPLALLFFDGIFLEFHVFHGSSSSPLRLQNVVFAGLHEVNHVSNKTCTNTLHFPYYYASHTFLPLSSDLLHS